MEESAGFILLRNTDIPSVLLLKHTNPHEWDLPKGHIQEYESPFEAAKRELGEETQINPAQIELPLSNQAFSYIYASPRGVQRRVTLFVARTEYDPVVSHEHRGYIWVGVDEAMDLLKHQEICDCLHEAFTQLSQC